MEANRAASAEITSKSTMNIERHSQELGASKRLSTYRSKMI